MTYSKYHINVPNIKIAFFIVFIYYLLNVLFPHDATTKGLIEEKDRIYPQIFAGLFFLYSIYYMFANFSFLLKDKFLKPFFCFYLLLMLYTLFPSVAHDSVYDHFIYFIKITFSLNVLFVFYLCLISDLGNVKWIYRLFAVQLIYSCFLIIYEYNRFLLVQLSDNVDLNSGFMLASLIPICFVLPRKRLRIYLYILLFCLTLFTGQRAAFLGALVTVPFALKLMRGNLKKVDYILLIIIGICLAYPIIKLAYLNFENRNEEDLSRGEDAFGAGRATFWKFVWDDFWSGDIFQLIFGRFYTSVPVLLEKTYGLKIYSHNGWLDMLYMFGLVGCFLYVRCYIYILKLNVWLKRTKLDEYKNIPLMMFLLLFVRSSVSHGNFDISYIPFFLTLSIIYVQYKKRAKSL